MATKGQLKEFCKRGHLLSGDNVKLFPRRGSVDRICKACSRENFANYRKTHPERESVKKQRQLGLLPPAPPRTHFNCGHLFTVENKYSYVSGSGKTIHECRECALTENRKKAQQSRNSHLKRKFGLTQTDFDAMLAAQGGVCGNDKCKSPEPGGMGAFHVDHDHLTGKIRALLCSRCNTMLGMVDDNPEIIQGLIDYLKEHNNG